jgi:hypothetical protein
MNARAAPRQNCTASRAASARGVPTGVPRRAQTFGHATVLQRNREIEKDLTPRFKDRPISKITRLELTAALKEVEARAPEVASNLRNDLWGIFEYAHRHRADR